MKTPQPVDSYEKKQMLFLRPRIAGLVKMGPEPTQILTLIGGCWSIFREFDTVCFSALEAYEVVDEGQSTSCTRSGILRPTMEVTYKIIVVVWKALLGGWA